MDEERHHFHDTSTHQDIHPDDRDAQGRFSALVRGAAERGEREVLALRLPSEYCTGGGRAINNFEPDWPHTLTGFARRAYEFWQRELEARGNKLPAQIMDFPGGNAGRCRGFSQVVSCFR